MKHIFSVFILFMLGFSLSAENPCNIMRPKNTGEWGIGICYFPEKAKIPFYFNDKDSIAGYIIRNKPYKFELEFLNDSLAFKINYHDYNWIGHSSTRLLKMYGVYKENYYRVFVQSNNKGILIKINELSQFGVEYFDYRSLIFDPSKIELPDEMERHYRYANIGLNLYKSCINLRQGPSTDHDIITCIKSNDWDNMKHTHMKIIEKNGDWAKIETITYKWKDYECHFYEFKRHRGWVKAIDSNERPNIWYSVTSY